MKKETVIEVKAPAVRYTNITIVGDGDLVLNKMNARTIRELTAARNGCAKSKDVPNIWEDVITAIHWRDEYPVKDTYSELSEAWLEKMLEENAPCITAFGLKKSFMQAVTQNKIDKYSTAFNASVNIVSTGGKIPVTFSAYHIDEKLMSPKRGAPVLARLSRFSGWSATFTISYVETAYSLEQIVDIINLAGFGLGIGSGRSSGYGRYHVVSVE